MSFPIRISLPKQEGLLQVSKWLKFQVLLDPEEMRELLEGDLYLANASEIVSSSGALVAKEHFFEGYAKYASTLAQGKVPDEAEFRSLFSSTITADLDALYAIEVKHDKYLLKPIQPVIQMQAHSFFYSHVDGKFHPLVLSAESVTWGIQLAYPQLYQDPKTQKIVKVFEGDAFANTQLFQTMQRWMRDATLPTPFEVDGVRTNSTIRIGKKALKWIENHPQLKEKGIKITSLRGT
ncbi:MAG: hypothetical protein V4492_02895 [Chlamydiota bacterium]